MTHSRAAKRRLNHIDLASLDEASSASLFDVVEAFTTDPMRSATVETLVREFGTREESVASALRVLEAFGVLERVAVPGESAPAYRFRVAATFLEVLERVSAVYADRLDSAADESEDLRALRARVATLESKNAFLTRKTAELSFLFDTAAELGSSLDQSAVARVVLEAVPAASNGRARGSFLALREGNEIVVGGGAGVDRAEAEEFVTEHYGLLDRSLRTGEVVSAQGGRVAIPMMGNPNEPGFGFIIVLHAGADGLTGVELTRLMQLAELAGRSFANAKLLDDSIAAGMTDELTGVYNRRYLDRRLGDELKRARRLGERVAVVLLDLDFFKNVNDEYGHPEGDRVLRAVADSIVAAVRDIDIVTRYGGEEFAIVVPGTDGQQAVAVAERVREAVEAMRLNATSGEPLRITVSCGVAWAAPHIHTPAQCIAAADLCLLEAKRTGRNKTISM